MLTWLDVLKYATNGNPEPENKVIKSDTEWKQLLTEDQYLIARQKGTERPFSSEMCHLFSSGKYACVCCKTPLFAAFASKHVVRAKPARTKPITK